MRFKTNIDSFDDVTEIGDTERIVRTNFNLTMKGYLLSESDNDKKPTTNKFITPKKVEFFESVEKGVIMDKPLPRKQRVLNRGYLYSRSGENIKNPEVTLIDIDSSILFYFDKVIQPSVEDNGENVKVPIMYSSPERWNL